MSGKSKIQWTDKVWNPVRGCSLVSPGCTNCYAMKMAHRFDGPGLPYEGLTRMTAHGAVWTGKIKLVPGTLEEPLRWKTPQRVFVNSMSDLFHEDVPFDFIKRVWLAMAHAHHTRGHTFQILTKRPERMREALGPNGIGWYAVNDAVPRPEPGIWLGVSVESPREVGRIHHILHTPAAVRFLSLEPLLEDLGVVPLTDYPEKIDWVIVGGESGPGARPCKVEWIESIVSQCRAARVPIFVKQLGGHPHFTLNGRDTCAGYLRACKTGDWRRSLMLKDRKGGDMSEWPESLRIREFPC